MFHSIWIALKKINLQCLLKYTYRKNWSVFSKEAEHYRDDSMPMLADTGSLLAMLLKKNPQASLGRATLFFPQCLSSFEFCTMCIYYLFKKSIKEVNGIFSRSVKNFSFYLLDYELLETRKYARFLSVFLNLAQCLIRSKPPANVHRCELETKSFQFQ